MLNSGVLSHVVNDSDVVTRPLSASVFFVENEKNDSGVYIPLSSPGLPPSAGT